MKPVCEVMVMEIFPGLRAILARSLMQKHGFSQKAAADRLGTTQPAVSQYMRQLRGSKIKSLESSPRIVQMLEGVAKKAADGSLSPEDISGEFCSVCRFMRKEGLACEYHRRMYPSLENCTMCMD